MACWCTNLKPTHTGTSGTYPVILHQLSRLPSVQCIVRFHWELLPAVHLSTPMHCLVHNVCLLLCFRFNACSLEGEEQFMLMGLVLGLAIYNRVLLDFPLPLALYKKLLGQAVGLRDLEEMQPMLGRSLRQLLQYEGPQSVEVVGGVGCLVLA
eukprot:GHRR01036819.1.p1 GENE.GHRR01036819.1~~GHRR01036819.1.p1  ORF type:complete len:153 (+),score=46.64 GHRR01036819.1:171-629(+)